MVNAPGRFLGRLYTGRKTDYYTAGCRDCEQKGPVDSVLSGQDSSGGDAWRLRRRKVNESTRGE
jgi:hypothetical protein